MNPQDPQTRVDSGPTPALDVRRSATIPATWTDASGTVHAENWPLVTQQEVEGIAADGSRVVISSTSTQNGPRATPVVIGSEITVDTNNDGRPEYFVGFQPSGVVTASGDVSTRGITPREARDLALAYDALTDRDQVSGADLNRALDQFKHAAGLRR